MHQILKRASPKVIKHVNKDDITINNTDPAPSTIECESCSLLKATEIVSRRTEVDKLENGVLFNCTT